MMTWLWQRIRKFWDDPEPEPSEIDVPEPRSTPDVIEGSGVSPTNGHGPPPPGLARQAPLRRPPEPACEPPPDFGPPSEGPPPDKPSWNKGGAP